MCAEKRKQLPMHKDSGRRLVPCTYESKGCKITMQVENMSEHTVSCPFRNATPNFVENAGRQELSQPNNVKCPLESLGCNFVGIREEVADHIQNAMPSHLELLVIFGSNTDLKALQSHSRLQSVSSDLRFKLKQIGQKLSATQEAGDRNQTMVRILTEELKLTQRNHDNNYQQLLEQFQTMKDDLKNKDEQIARLQRELRDIAELERVARVRLEMMDDDVYIDSAELSPAPHQEQPNEFQIQEEVLECGVQVMEIRGFAKEMRRAIANRLIALNSEPFVTTCGVELRVKVLLNGDEKEGEPCMTVFVVIIKGRNDEHLNWPFRGRVSLHIYDPEKSDYEFIDSFETSPDHVSFQKPLTERNIGYGFLKSISYIDLRRMVTEDKLVIKVIVDAVVN